MYGVSWPFFSIQNYLSGWATRFNIIIFTLVIDVNGKEL